MSPTPSEWACPARWSFITVIAYPHAIVERASQQPACEKARARERVSLGAKGVAIVHTLLEERPPTVARLHRRANLRGNIIRCEAWSPAFPDPSFVSRLERPCCRVRQSDWRRSRPCSWQGAQSGPSPADPISASDLTRPGELTAVCMAIAPTVGRNFAKWGARL